MRMIDFLFRLSGIVCLWSKPISSNDTSKGFFKKSSTIEERFELDRLIEDSYAEALNEILNKTLEEILLNEKSCFRDIEARFANLFPQLNLLLEQN